MMEIRWSEVAKDDYAELLKYLNDYYGVDVAINFMDKTDEVIQQISEFPFSGQITKKKNVRRVVITKVSSIIYQVKGNIIEVLLLWDNRQNPENFDD